MIIFKDKNSGAEMFTDATKYTLVDDVVYEVEGKIITVKDDMSNVNIGANESQEEASEGLEEGMKRGVNVVIYSRLEELTDYAKYTVEQYMKYMKSYMKTLALPEDAEEKAALQKKISGYLNKALGKKWKNLEKFDQFYGEGAGNDPEKLPMVVLLNYREEDDTPYLVYFKHGLIEEKV
ncbi:translationally-controlled tumor protein homolog [Asterias amurensis]|uniref:translationally-controlled tumor protein homolog n=1 Tax=Asterias amurensis TaxID=7602 RepID=UPI003AB693FD